MLCQCPANGRVSMNDTCLACERSIGFSDLALAEKVDVEVTTEIRPNYYRTTVNGHEVECFAMIDALRFDFYLGNVLKYLWRAGRKTAGVDEDLKKARTYLNQAIDRLEPL